MIKACIFDLDGTIADTIETITYYGNRALKKFGFDDIDSETYKLLVGNGYELLVKNMLDTLGVYSDDVYNEMKKFYHDDYETDSMYKTKIYDGMENLIKFLDENGIKRGVLTNKPQGAADDVIKYFFDEGTFQIVSGISDGDMLKPDPQRLYAMLEKMNVKNDEVLYFGDTKTDMLTGKNGNLFTIGVLWGFRSKEELTQNGADMIVSHPDEIIEYIKNENNI